MDLLLVHQAQARGKAYLAKLHDRELDALEAQRFNEATQALSFAPVPKAPKKPLLARLTRLLPRFS
jgi:hypothetical protein